MQFSGNTNRRGYGKQRESAKQYNSNGVELLRDAESVLTCMEYECYITLVAINRPLTDDENTRLECLMHKVRNRRRGVKRDA